MQQNAGQLQHHCCGLHTACSASVTQPCSGLPLGGVSKAEKAVPSYSKCQV